MKNVYDICNLYKYLNKNNGGNFLAMNSRKLGWPVISPGLK